MKSIILYLKQEKISLCCVDQEIDSFTSERGTYYLENIYFADWIPLRNCFQQIIGFKIVPWVTTIYFDENVKPADFMRLAVNLACEKGPGNYFSIVIAEGNAVGEGMNQIEAAILFNEQRDFVLRIDGIDEEDWRELKLASELLEHQ